MRVAAPIAAIAVAAIVTVALLGSKREPRLAGTNGVEPAAFIADLAGGERHCQKGEFVPADSASVEVRVERHDRPLPAIEVRILDSANRVVVAHTVPGGGTQNDVRLPLGRTLHEPTRDATVCFQPDAQLGVAGYDKTFRLAWYRPGEESLWQVAGTGLHRFGLGKPDWAGSWTFALATLLAASAWVLTARLLLREGRG